MCATVPLCASCAFRLVLFFFFKSILVCLFSYFLLDACLFCNEEEKRGVDLGGWRA